MDTGGKRLQLLSAVATLGHPDSTLSQSYHDQRIDSLASWTEEHEVLGASALALCAAMYHVEGARKVHISIARCDQRLDDTTGYITVDMELSGDSIVQDLLTTMEMQIRVLGEAQRPVETAIWVTALGDSRFDHVESSTSENTHEDEYPPWVVLLGGEIPGSARLLSRRDRSPARQVALFQAKYMETISELSNKRYSKLQDVGRITSADVAPSVPETQRALGEDLCIHDLVGRSWANRPDSVAIAAWDGDLSYGDLDKLSEALAIQLERLRLPEASSVIHYMEHSKWAIVAYLGILRAGHVCVPVSSSNPRGMVREIAGLTKARAITCSAPYELDDHDCLEHVVLPTATEEQVQNQDSLRATVSPSAPAIIMFTSGSTGTPAGVLQRHDKVSRSCSDMVEVLGLSEDTRYLNFASYAFDASVNEVFTTLTAGGCICVPSESERQQSVSEAISKYSVTHTCLTNTVASLMDLESVPTLRQLSLGGEPVSGTLIERWADRVQVNVLYGLTEGAVWDTVSASLSRSSDPSVIGRPVRGRVWILHPDDPDLLVPYGAPGEICLQSDVLSIGYQGEQTAKSARFLGPTPWSKESSDNIAATLYRTGDLGKFNEDGSVTLIGRLDHQIKIRGQRINLIEVQNRLVSQLDVEMEIVVDAIDQPGGIVLFAFASIQQERQTASSSQDLQEILESAITKMKSNTPTYMVPRHADDVSGLLLFRENYKTQELSTSRRWR